MKPIISIEIPNITDSTYILNPDKDPIVSLTTSEPITDITLADGSKVTGDNLVKETVVKTTLGEIKSKVADLEKKIADANANIPVWQKELDDLNVQVGDVQTAIDEATVTITPPEPLPTEPIVS